jgi:hypothetical protein
MYLKKKKGYHRHHIIPKHQGGDDSKENLIYLTPEEHALAHLELYEKYGKYEDAQAFNSLSAQWLDGRSIDGYKQSEEHIKKRIASMDYEAISEKLKERYKNQPHHSLGRKNGPHTEETKRKISESLKGMKKDNSKGLVGQYWVGKQRHKFCCIGCQQPVAPSRIDRHGKCFKEYSSRID